MKKAALAILLFTFCVCSCDGQKKWVEPEKEKTNNEGITPREPHEKEKMLWIAAEENFELLASKMSIRDHLLKAKAAGFNKIVVDVKGVGGEVFYHSDILPYITSNDGHTIVREWDYLAYFLEQAKELDLKVTVSATIFGAGKPRNRTGLVYNDSRWDGKTCLQYNTDGTFTDIREDASKVSAFLNPHLPEVQQFVLSFIEELVTKYDFDAFALDYCRFPDEASDFSDFTRQAFESYLGKTLTNFPGDIFTYNASGERIPGPYYKQWWTFRSKTITDFVGRAKTTIKSIKPDVELEYWAASWWQALYATGQNWASTNYNPATEYGWWAEDRYASTGFANHLDTFLLGAYLSKIYGPSDAESIEYAINRSKRLIGSACKVYGTISAPSLRNSIADAIYLCLKESDGLMVFDISQVVEFNLWDSIKKGIDSYENP